MELLPSKMIFKAKVFHKIMVLVVAHNKAYSNDMHQIRRSETSSPEYFVI